MEGTLAGAFPTPPSPSPTADVSAGEAGAHVLGDENDEDDLFTGTDLASESAIGSPPPSAPPSPSPETEATLEHPHRVISPSNLEKALKEITPSSSESLGTLSELRKWNDEFGEGKREKRRNMWGKGSFGFVERGEGQGEIKVAASGSGGSGPSPA